MLNEHHFCTKKKKKQEFAFSFYFKNWEQIFLYPGPLKPSVHKEAKAHTVSLQGRHFPPITNLPLLQLLELNCHMGKSIKRA